MVAWRGRAKNFSWFSDTSATFQREDQLPPSSSFQTEGVTSSSQQAPIILYYLHLLSLNIIVCLLTHQILLLLPVLVGTIIIIITLNLNNDILPTLQLYPSTIFLPRPPLMRPYIMPSFLFKTLIQLNPSLIYHSWNTLPVQLKPTLMFCTMDQCSRIPGFPTGVVVRPEVSSLRVVGSSPTQWTGLSI